MQSSHRPTGPFGSQPPRPSPRVARMLSYIAQPDASQRELADDLAALLRGGLIVSVIDGDGPTRYAPANPD